LGVTNDPLSAGLRAASAGLAAVARLPPGRVPPAELDRLQRQFRAVCDAAKAPGADPAARGRRLAALLAELDSLTDGKSGNKG
jgi:hypothetical protein